MPLVSVVVLTHNNWPDLELAIESVLNQSYRNLEVVVIDNGSTDATEREVPARYGSRLRYIRQGNVYDAAGYNRGIRETTGPFVQLLDGDDFLAPNKIEKQMERLVNDSSAHVAYGDVRQFQSRAGEARWSDWDHVPPDRLLDELTRPNGHSGLMTHTVLFRRKAIEAVGPWDESILGADPDYWMRALSAGCRFVYVEGGWSFYRRRNDSIGARPKELLTRIEATLIKARAYINDPGQQRHIDQRLAALWYSGAVLDGTRTRTDAMNRLRLARRTDPDQISPVLFALASAAIYVPGLRATLKHPSFARFRQSVAKNLGLLIKR